MYKIMIAIGLISLFSLTLHAEYTDTERIRDMKTMEEAMMKIQKGLLIDDRNVLSKGVNQLQQVTRKVEPPLESNSVLAQENTYKYKFSRKQGEKIIQYAEDIKKLAMLNKVEWEKILKKSAKKIVLAGRPINTKMIAFHASSLARKLEKKYTSVAFLAQLERSEGKDTQLKNPKNFIAFMKKHEEFELESTNIEPFMKKKKLSLLRRVANAQDKDPIAEGSISDGIN